MSMPEDIRIFRVTPTVISFLDYTAVSRRKDDARGPALKKFSHICRRTSPIR